MMKVMKSLCARVESAKDRRPVVIAFLGDSVTHGCFEVYVNRQGNVDTRYRPDQGYPARLKRRLDLLYPAAAVSVINAGISGDNAPGGLARLERDVLSFRPDLVVVGFALNDCMNKAPDALMTYRGAMGRIMDRVLESGAECLILTPNFMNEYLDPALPQGVLRDIAQDTMRAQQEGVLESYVRAAKEEAARRGVPVADAYARWQAMGKAGVDTTSLLANHINHPLPELHELFAEEILRAMMEE